MLKRHFQGVVNLKNETRLVVQFLTQSVIILCKIFAQLVNATHFMITKAY